MDLSSSPIDLDLNKCKIQVRANGQYKNHFSKFKPKTVRNAKQSISRECNVKMTHLYCINPGGDNMPNDKDEFKDEFIIEIVMSMDNIEMERALDQGEFARIFLCRDKISNKQFVLKKPIKDGDICRDINIYNKLDSARNIVNYSALFRYRDSICIGMEYLSGGSLKSYLKTNKYLSEQEIVQISHEILIQINELHKLGIIHRDIKPDNIVMDEHNHAKLIDFGISIYAIGLTSKKLSKKLKEYDPRMFRYMAPELTKNEKICSEKIDIWSFGMVMVEMVTGKRPFDEKKIQGQIIPKLFNFTKYEFEPIIKISDKLKQFIDFCLHINTDVRPSAEQLIETKFKQIGDISELV